MSQRGWIGVDLDGTLAEYHGWKGIEHIGEPVPEMLERVKYWIESGHRVKILTARAGESAAIPHIEAWLTKHGLSGIEITNVKDFGMYEIWDDRAVQVEENTGKVIGYSRRGLK